MLRGADVICLASIDWAFNRQNAQEVASAFAAGGNRVLFIENTGVRRPGLRDLPRLRARLGNWLRARRGLPKVEGVDLLSPVILPFPYSRAAGAINQRILLRAVRRWVGPSGDRPLIIITFLPTPLACAMIRRLDPALAVYYCIDRLRESSPQARRLEESEPELLAASDLVLVTSHGLHATAAGHAPCIEFLPSGVRFAAFEEARRSNGHCPAVFDGLTGPVAGFVGSIRGQLDMELVARAAELAPDLNFIFVGPVVTDVRRLRALPNVRLAPAVPHDAVMRHMVRFDAGLLPYVLDDYTAHLMPAKLKEYLAAGLPIVSTPLPEVRYFAEKHPGLIDFAADAREFVDAIRAAIGRKDRAAVDQRLDVARQYDWSTQLARISNLMESLVDARVRERV